MSEILERRRENEKWSRRRAEGLRWDSRAQLESTAAEGIAFSDMVQHFIEEVKVFLGDEINFSRIVLCL